jgi:hypothetical protein
MNSEYKIYIQIVLYRVILVFKTGNGFFKKLIVGHVYKHVVDLMSIPSCGIVYYVYDEV